MLEYINLDNPHKVIVTQFIKPKMSSRQSSFNSYVLPHDLPNPTSTKDFSDYKDAVIYVRENISQLYKHNPEYVWEIIDNVTVTVVKRSQ